MDIFYTLPSSEQKSGDKELPTRLEKVQSFPSERIIQNIMNYSLALNVLKTSSGQAITYFLN